MPKPERLDDAMLFDFEALWGSDHVKLMSGLELAVYVRLLSCQWREGDLPSDPRLLALRASHGTRTVTPEQLLGAAASTGCSLADAHGGSIWQALAPCYVVDGDVVYNSRVRADRAAWLRKKRKWAKKSSAAGKASAEARRVLKESTSGEPLVEPLVQPQVHSLSPSSSSSPPSPGKKGETKTSPPSASDDAGARAATKAERDFARWWPAYPNAKGKAKALVVWRQMKAADRDADAVLSFLAVAVESEAWTKEGGRYIPHGDTFTRGKIWQDGSGAYPPARGNGNAQTAGASDYQEPGQVEGYLLRKVHLEGLRSFPEEMRDTDETDEDLALFEASLRLELDAINASPELKRELRTQLEAT